MAPTAHMHSQQCLDFSPDKMADGDIKDLRVGSEHQWAPGQSMELLDSFRYIWSQRFLTGFRSGEHEYQSMAWLSYRPWTKVAKHYHAPGGQCTEPAPA